jgi:hypothetical protein
MATSAGAVELTKVDSTQQFPLGLEHTVEPVMAGIASADLNRGVQVWVYIESAGTIVAGTVVGRSAGTTTYKGTLAPVDSNPLRILGVAQHAIASGSYGWILKRGLGEVLAGTETIDANEVVAVSAATAGAGMEGGSIAADAHEAAVIGFATEDAAAAALATCYINCPG